MRFQFGNALTQRRDGGLHFGSGIARRDVLRTVPIEGNNFNEEEPFYNLLDLRFGELPDEFGMLSRVFDTGMTKDFQPCALRSIRNSVTRSVTARLPVESNWRLPL